MASLEQCMKLLDQATNDGEKLFAVKELQRFCDGLERTRHELNSQSLREALWHVGPNFSLLLTSDSPLVGELPEVLIDKVITPEDIRSEVKPEDIKPEVLKSEVLKPEVLKLEVLKSEVGEPEVLKREVLQAKDIKATLVTIVLLFAKDASLVTEDDLILLISEIGDVIRSENHSTCERSRKLISDCLEFLTLVTEHTEGMDMLLEFELIINNICFAAGCFKNCSKEADALLRKVLEYNAVEGTEPNYDIKVFYFLLRRYSDFIVKAKTDERFRLLDTIKCIFSSRVISTNHFYADITWVDRLWDAIHSVLQEKLPRCTQESLVFLSIAMHEADATFPPIDDISPEVLLRLTHLVSIEIHRTLHDKPLDDVLRRRCYLGGCYRLLEVIAYHVRDNDAILKAMTIAIVETCDFLINSNKAVALFERKDPHAMENVMSANAEWKQLAEDEDPDFWFTITSMCSVLVVFRPDVHTVAYELIRHVIQRVIFVTSVLIIRVTDSTRTIDNVMVFLRNIVYHENTRQFLCIGKLVTLATAYLESVWKAYKACQKRKLMVETADASGQCSNEVHQTDDKTDDKTDEETDNKTKDITEDTDRIDGEMANLVRTLDSILSFLTYIMTNPPGGKPIDRAHYTKLYTFSMTYLPYLETNRTLTVVAYHVMAMGLVTYSRLLEKETVDPSIPFLDACIELLFGVHDWQSPMKHKSELVFSHRVQNVWAFCEASWRVSISMICSIIAKVPEVSELILETENLDAILLVLRKLDMLKVRENMLCPYEALLVALIQANEDCKALVVQYKGKDVAKHCRFKTLQGMLRTKAKHNSHYILPPDRVGRHLS